MTGACRLRAVLDDHEVVLLSEAHDLSHGAGLAVQMRRYDSAGFIGDRGFDPGRVDIKCRRVNIDKDWFQSGAASNFRNYPERERRKNNFTSRRKFERAQNVVAGHAAE